MINKKAQYWYMDLIIAITIFSFTLIIAYRFITFAMANQDENLILREADKISEVIVSAGIPSNWTPENVFVIGLTNGNNVLNLTKVEYLKNMTEEDYDNTRHTMAIQSELLLFFENKDGNITKIIDEEYIGKPGFTLDTVKSLNPKDQITLTRYVVYKHDDIAEIVALKLMFWDEK